MAAKRSFTLGQVDSNVVISTLRIHANICAKGCSESNKKSHWTNSNAFKNTMRKTIWHALWPCWSCKVYSLFFEDFLFFYDIIISIFWKIASVLVYKLKRCYSGIKITDQTCYFWQLTIIMNLKMISMERYNLEIKTFKNKQAHMWISEKDTSTAMALSRIDTFQSYASE